ncbi:MAG: hypothetical protein KAK00_01580 [Nanoarchaeota archaeon]|nr:hypothetical protein [Nanoarchaeota archaeon]
MNEIIARKKIDENGDEIIELDLNKPWPKRASSTYTNYKDDLEKMVLSERNSRRKPKEFITLLN